MAMRFFFGFPLFVIFFFFLVLVWFVISFHFFLR
uniref:Uncharacterized protein n=1 Tax=Picea sitchensis TaxID=3332 RepID=D5ABP5_PICSI|nr:unknown [Picea sitchensis]